MISVREYYKNDIGDMKYDGAIIVSNLGKKYRIVSNTLGTYDAEWGGQFYRCGYKESTIEYNIESKYWKLLKLGKTICQICVQSMQNAMMEKL